MNDIIAKFEYRDNLVIDGLTKELSLFYVLDYYKKVDKSIILLMSSMYEANKYYNALSFYTDKVLLFPEDDFISSVALVTSPELQLKRLEVLEKVSTGSYIIITNLNGYLKKLPNKEDYVKEFKLSLGSNISRIDLENQLEEYGFKKESIVTSTGEYAVRGFVVDLFNPREEHPVRLEFFGDTIESIRYFDENTQKSLELIKDFVIKPFTEIKTTKNNNLLDYLIDPTVIYFDETQIKASYEKLLLDVVEYKKVKEDVEYSNFYYDLKQLSPDHKLNINFLHSTGLEHRDVITYRSLEIESFRNNFELLKEYALKNMYQKKIVITVSNEKQINILRVLFDEIHIVKNNDYLFNIVNVEKLRLHQGFIIDDFIFISEYDIETKKDQSIKYKNDYKIGQKLKSVEALKHGDYVVHRSHGIAVYNGVFTLTQRGLKKDYIQLNYSGKDKVFIPVEKINTIFKYTDKDGMKPRIDKLNSTSWAIRKRSIQKRIKDISEELIKLYAKRNSMEAPAYIDNEMEMEFALSFPYTLTRDQDRATQDINRDLKSKVPMDRLLCGDVGFGKTEVAFRAMFKTVLNNFQVFYLCPTTILSKQQFESAKERFKDYPIEMALLNRFTTKKEAKVILERLKEGKIDIVFGTHRLLSEDISFKKLGLLVVDEEQRFGVSHKEKLKKYKTDVNVLTLSATPIPRTLKMSLTGLRDLSIIDTAPVNRFPVQTYVLQENDLFIKDAIYKELARDGQTFILFNDIANIEEKMSKIQKLVPEARIRYAHGQMSKNDLEDIMDAFINHEFDILLCTTIIETGIDIPNANTLIIYKADYFGLSQLYQLRGRVGRSNKIAYAYFMYSPMKMLNDLAVKRLQAIKDFTELGSGYKIAMRDLSIRGAGDILGSEQAGFVDSIGISLYMKMIEEEMQRQKGIEVKEEEIDNKSSLLQVETHINDAYVSDEDLKIEIHQKINEVKNYQSLLDVLEELKDRFGTVPEELVIYMYEEWFEKIAEQLNITRVTQTEQLISVELPTEISSKIKGDKLFLEAYSVHPSFTLKYLNQRITISLPIRKLEKHFVYYLVPLFDLIQNDFIDS